MTDYEAKFHELGTPINRCVGTKEHLEIEPEFQTIPGPDFRRAPNGEASEEKLPQPESQSE